ncbi:MAG TPA: NAD-dependent epimerase/dehydratase family protein [Tepidisphaeraceae bacterium]|jgi:nucleoside-diphosphate-sugar epimerase
MRYAILGATGTVGKTLAAALAAAGESFRVIGRSQERLQRDFQHYGPLADARAADVDDHRALADALRDVETVFYTVGVPYNQFELHPKLMRSALAAATAAGVARFVHVGTVYPYGLPRTDFVSESHPREPHTFKGRMRKEQEDLVLGADKQRGMRTTLVRPPDFYGPDAELSYVADIFKAAVNGGTANVIGPIDTPHEFIYVPDVARALVMLSGKPEAYGRPWNLAGPGPITTRRFAELVFRAAGREQPRLRVAGKTTLRMLGLFNPILREVVEMHYLWTDPVLLDDREIQALLPDLTKTRYENGIRQTVDAMRAR